MTKYQRIKLNQLYSCTFIPGSYNKRFVQSLHSFSDETELTEKQAACLEKMYHRYRRQIPNHQKLCTICTPQEITP